MCWQIHPIKKRHILSIPLCLMVTFLDEFVVAVVVTVNDAVVDTSVVIVVCIAITWVRMIFFLLD